MFNEQLLVDIGLSIQLLDDSSGTNQFNGNWLKDPLGTTDTALALLPNREKLLDALEEILEVPLNEADGVARLVIPGIVGVELAFTLRASPTGICLGVSLGVDSPVVDAHLELELLEYRPSGTPGLAVLSELDARLSFDISPPSQEPFESLGVETRYQTGISNSSGGGVHAALTIDLTLTGLKGSEDTPLTLSFVLDPLNAPVGWEGQLIQVGFFGLRALLLQLSNGQSVDTTLKKASDLVLEHLLPLFGWVPPAQGSSLEPLPPLDLQAFFADPETAFQGWLRTTFQPVDSRPERVRSMLTHMTALVSLDQAGPAVGITGGEAMTGFGQMVFGAPLITEPMALGIPKPSILMWIRQQNPSDLTLCLGLRVEVLGPQFGSPATSPSDPFLHAEPALELNIELVSVPLIGAFVAKAFRYAELVGTLRPIGNAPYVMGNLNGPSQGDPVLEHLERFVLGLTLIEGEMLKPVVELIDLKVDNQTWNRLDLTNSGALMEVGAAAAIDAITDGLDQWLGSGLGDPIAQLLGLRRPNGLSAWPLVVPAPINGVSDPCSSQKLSLLVSDLSGAYRTWLYDLLDPASLTQNGFQQWLESLRALLDAIHTQPIPAVSGSGTAGAPWKVRLLPDTDPLGIELDLHLCFWTEATNGQLPNSQRRLFCELRLDVLKEALSGNPLTNGANITAGLKAEILDVQLERALAPTNIQPFPPVTILSSRWLDSVRMFMTLDSDLQLNPPSLNGDPARVVRAELGEAEAAFVWTRGVGLHTSLGLTGARIVDPTAPTTGNLLIGPRFTLRDLEPGGGLGALSTHLLLGTFALDQAGATFQDQAYTRAADALLGIQQFMGYVPTALAPRGWPAFDASLGNLDSIEGLKSFFEARGPEGFFELLRARLRDPGSDPAGVGPGQVLEWLGVLANGQVSPWIQNLPFQLKSGLLGSWENPYSVTVVRGANGLEQLEVIAWKIQNTAGTTTHVGLGVRGAALKKTKDDITVHGVGRIDIAKVDITVVPIGVPANQLLSWLPINLRYEATIKRENGSPLYKNGTDEAGELCLGLAYDENLGLFPTLELRDAMWQGNGPTGPGKQTIGLEHAMASPLLNAIQNMDKSPFKVSQKHPALALLLVFEAVGVFTLGAGGPSGFLANPIQRFKTDPGAYLREQFIDPTTGILRLHALARALDGNGDSSISLLQLLDMKRDVGEKGMDLTLEPNGTLRFTVVDSTTAGTPPWIDVGFNPYTRGFSFDVKYDFGVGSASTHFSNSQSGTARPFALWVDLDQDIIEKFVGGNRIDIVPPDWNTLARILGIVVGSVGTVIWLWLVLKHRVEPWMKKDPLANGNPNRLKPVFIAAKLLIPDGNDHKIPGLIGLIKYCSSWEKNLLGRPTLEALQDAIGAWAMFKNQQQKHQFLFVLQSHPRNSTPGGIGAQAVNIGMNATTSPPGLPTTAVDGAFVRYGTLEPEPVPVPQGRAPYVFGRMPLGQHGAMNIHLRAGGPWKSGNVLDLSKLAVNFVLGGLALWTGQDTVERRFGMEAMIDQTGTLRLDLLVKGPNASNELRLPLFPMYDLQRLAQLFGPTQGVGRMVIAVVLERLVRTLHVLCNKQDARDLVVHLMAGLGTVKKVTGTTTYVEDLKWNPTTGELELDLDKLKELTPVAATPIFPQKLHEQFDMFWISEALFDLGQLYQLKVKGIDQNQQPYTRNGPPRRTATTRYLKWDILEASANKPLDLSLVAGNYPHGLDKYLTQGATTSSNPGIGVLLDLHLKNQAGKSVLRVGHDKDPLLWGWLKTSSHPMKFVTQLRLPADAFFTLPKSQHDLHIGHLFEILIEGNDPSFKAFVNLETGRWQDYRGLSLTFLPSVALAASSKDTARNPVNPNADATALVKATEKGEAILSLSATLLTELLMMEAAAGTNDVFDARIPFVNVTIGDLLSGIRDTASPRRALLTPTPRVGENRTWASDANPAHLSLDNLMPDLMYALSTYKLPPPPAQGAQHKNSSGSSIKFPEVAMAVDGKRYGVEVKSGDSIKLLPFADLVMGDDGSTSASALTLWMLEYDGTLASVRFKPGLSFKDVGFRFHGRDDARLLDSGPVTLKSVSVLGAGDVGNAGTAFGGARLAIEELAIPLGRAKGDGASSKLLSGDGANPGFSVVVSYNYDGPNTGFKLAFFGGQQDPQTGVHWFVVGRKTEGADIGRIGLLHQANAAGLSDDRVKFLVDGGFGLGPLKVEVQGFGISFLLKEFYDPTKWQVELAGLAISYVTDTVTLMGALVREPPTAPGLAPGYVGAAILKVKAFEFTALAAWSQIEVEGKKESSLFVFARLTAKPGLGGPPFFFVTGVAGGFGYNRAFNLPPMAQLPQFPLITAMSDPPPQPGKERESAMAKIKSIQEALPAKNDAYWIAMGVTYTSFVVVKGMALLYAKLDDGFTIGLLGLAYFRQPASKPVINVGLALDASFSTAGNDPRFLLQAQLTADSWVLDERCQVFGGFALGVWFKRGDMVITLGGYHPAFPKPEHYPDVPRVGIRFQPIPELIIKGESYFALTPRELMAGSLVGITYFKANKDHPLKGTYAFFEMGFDMRLGWDPFFYDFHLFIHISAELRNKEGRAWLGPLRAGADLWIWGPKFGGEARAYLGPFSVEFTFGVAKQLEKNWIPLDTFIKKTLLPESDGTAAPYDMIDGSRYMLKRTARPSVSAGRRVAPGDSSTTQPNRLEVQAEFQVDLRLVSPATSITLLGPAAAGSPANTPPVLSPLNVVKPDGSSTQAFTAVDLAPAGKANWHLPLFVAVKNASGQLISLVNNPTVEVSATASGFPSAAYDLDAGERGTAPMTTTLADGLSVRFKKQRAPGMTFREQPESQTVSPGVALTLPGKSGKGTTTDTTWQAELLLAEQRANSGAQLKSASIGTDINLKTRQVAQSSNRKALAMAASGSAAAGTVQNGAGTVIMPGASTSVTVNAPSSSLTRMPNGALRQTVELQAGGSAVIQVENSRSMDENRSSFMSSGNSYLLMTAFDRSGQVITQGSAAKFTNPNYRLPKGTTFIALTALGDPTAPDSPWVGKDSATTSNYANLYYSKPNVTAVLGCHPFSLLMHAGKGAFVVRGGTFRLLNQEAIRWPTATLTLARTALEKATRIEVDWTLQAGAGTMMVHLRPGKGQTAVRAAAAVQADIVVTLRDGVPETLSSQVVTYNGELAILYALPSARLGLPREITLKGPERVAAISLHQSAMSGVATQLAQGNGWLAAEELSYSQVGSTTVVVEVQNG